MQEYVTRERREYPSPSIACTVCVKKVMYLECSYVTPGFHRGGGAGIYPPPPPQTTCIVYMHDAVAVPNKLLPPLTKKSCMRSGTP